MTDEPTEKHDSYFFVFDNKPTKEREKLLRKRPANSKKGPKENEWLQEYELIYLSHKHENWNLEPPKTHKGYE